MPGPGPYGNKKLEKRTAVKMKKGVLKAMREKLKKAKLAG
jgi:hypothetical protein